jgi:hypothetical protein
MVVRNFVDAASTLLHSPILFLFSAHSHETFRLAFETQPSIRILSFLSLEREKVKTRIHVIWVFCSLESGRHSMDHVCLVFEKEAEQKANSICITPLFRLWAERRHRGALHLGWRYGFERKRRAAHPICWLSTDFLVKPKKSGHDEEGRREQQKEAFIYPLLSRLLLDPVPRNSFLVNVQQTQDATASGSSNRFLCRSSTHSVLVSRCRWFLSKNGAHHSEAIDQFWSSIRPSTYVIQTFFAGFFGGKKDRQHH